MRPSMVGSIWDTFCGSLARTAPAFTAGAVMPTDHREIAFEDAVEHHLLNMAGYTQGDPADFDRERAIDPTVFLAFVQESQPTTWEALEKLHGADTAIDRPG